MAISIDDLLRRAVENKSSDLHLKSAINPYLRVDGLLAPMTDVPRVTPEEMLSMAFSMMTNRQKQKFKETAELDMAYGVAGLGRFRVNVFQQRGNVGMVLRVIPTKIRTTEELNLPAVVTRFARSSAAWCWLPGPLVPVSPPRWRDDRPHQCQPRRSLDHHRRSHRIPAP